MKNRSERITEFSFEVTGTAAPPPDPATDSTTDAMVEETVIEEEVPLPFFNSVPLFENAPPAEVDLMKTLIPERWSLELPEPADLDEDDEVTMSVELGAAGIFARYDEDS